MSDISASDAGEAVSEAPAGDVTEEAFDLDAAVEEFAANAPEDWKAKASKIQSELKGLRNKYTPYRDTFEGLHEDDQNAVFQLVTAIKSGNADGAAEWMFNAAKGLTGDQFEAKFGITKAEAQAAVDAVEEAPEPELSIEERIQKALDERDKAHKDEVANRERQDAINSKFSELGLNVERDKNGLLVDTKAQMVAQFAIKNGGDIDKGYEAFNKWLGDAAKDFVQTKGVKTLVAEGGETAGTPDNGAENMTPAQRAQARINRLAGGPQA